MSTKSFRVYFYQVNEGSKGETFNVFKAISTHGPQVHRDYEVRDVSISGTVVKGVLARLRDDAPHKREANGNEVELDIKDDESLIEKSYFIYYSAAKILVWQYNKSTGSVHNLSDYMSAFSSAAVTFDAIPNKKAINKISTGNFKRLEIGIAKPKAAASYPADDFRGEELKRLSKFGGDKIFVQMYAAEGLTIPKVKAAIKLLRSDANTIALKVKMDNETDVIDLLADVVKSRITVQMDGRYPKPDAVWAELNKAKDKHKDELAEYTTAD